MSNTDKDRIRGAFAKRFRCALAEMGYSANEQKRMQQLFGVSGQAVHKWAEGLSMPTSSRIPQIAKILGVRRAWLQDGENPMRPVVQVIAENGEAYSAEKYQGITLTPEEAELLEMYRTLSPKKRAAFKSLLAELIE